MKINKGFWIYQDADIFQLQRSVAFPKCIGTDVAGKPSASATLDCDTNCATRESGGKGGANPRQGGFGELHSARRYDAPDRTAQRVFGSRIRGGQIHEIWGI